MPDLHAVLFDMDGLLLDSEAMAKQAFDQVLVQHDLPPNMHLFAQMIGLNAASGAAVLDRGLPGHLDRAAFHATWQDIYRDLTSRPVPLRPTVVETLDALAGKYPLIVATSTRRSGAERKLELVGLRHHFEAMICGDEVTHGKPAPEIFSRAAALAGVPPSHAAAFEDSENGVRAAHGAGCAVAQIPDLVAPSPALHALGHVIAPTLMAGAQKLGLIQGT